MKFCENIYLLLHFNCFGELQILNTTFLKRPALPNTHLDCIRVCIHLSVVSVTVHNMYFRNVLISDYT